MRIFLTNDQCCDKKINTESQIIFSKNSMVICLVITFCIALFLCGCNNNDKAINSGTNSNVIEHSTSKPSKQSTPEPAINSSVYTRKDNYIYFGSYPQSEVTDDTIKHELIAIAGSTERWNSYGYYIEGKQSDFMKYKDVTYGGNKYRGVYFTQYRPYNTSNSSSTSNSVQAGNGYYTNTIYWFKYEPIKWKILEEANGDAFLVTEMLIDSQDYNHTMDNNYANSSIRKWLNETFYNTAFNSTERGLIKTTNVDNSASSTGDYSNPYACSNTNDKIFLLSYEEATNSSYGFSRYAHSTLTREKYLTAYAKAQGEYSSSGCGWWWLRSPDGSDSDYACAIHFSGHTFNHDYDVNVLRGVVAALHLTLS